LDFVPDKIPFDISYGPPISLDQAQAVIHAAVAEAKKRDWKMNAAVVDSGGNFVAFQRMDGAMHLNYLLAFDGIIASRSGIPLIEQGKTAIAKGDPPPRMGSKR
jgi:hypothetical protein